MNTDIRLSTEFWGHPKTNKLIKRLGIEGARSLQILWLWAVKNRPDGNLTGMDWEDIEFVADWHGEEMAFFGQCLACSWIDEVDGGYAIHDWAEHNPWQAEARARSEQARKSAQARWDKQRAKLAHKNSKADSMPDKCGSNADAMLTHNFSNAPLLSSPIQNALKDNTSPYGEVCAEQSVDCSTPPPKPVPKTVVVLPLNTGEGHNVTEDDVREWQELYPAVDVAQALRNMKGWLEGSPRKRKTKNGIGRFIHAWLGKEQDRGGNARSSPAQAPVKSWLEREDEANFEAAMAQARAREAARAAAQGGRQ